MSAIAARASAAQRAAWNGSSGRTRSSAWCGHAAPLVGASAWRCRCPCRRRPAASRRRRSRRPRARPAPAPSALLPDAVGPSTASESRSERVAGTRRSISTAEAPLDLAERHAQQHRAAVRAVRAEIDPSSWPSSASASGRPSTSPARTTLWQAMVASRWSTRSSSPSRSGVPSASSPSTLAEQRLRVGVLERLGHARAAGSRAGPWRATSKPSAASTSSVASAAAAASPTSIGIGNSSRWRGICRRACAARSRA